MSASRKRVLVVEDQGLVAADLVDTLRRLGYTVAGSVASGEEAILKAVETQPDLVLMDIRLRGEMDGIQAATAIREHRDIPIIYLTAYADEETLARAMVTGPFGYLVKPFNERELRAAIDISIYKHGTDQQLAEERARRQFAEEFRFFVEAVEDYAIYLLDPAGHIRTWNTGAERIKGYSAEEIIGRPVAVFYPAEALAVGKPDADLKAALAHGRLEDEGWRLRKDGSRFWANVTLTAVRDEQGQVRGFAKVTQDMTARREAELRLRQAEHDAQDAIRARDEFLQIASHELKTPLTPLQLELDVLARIHERSSQDERFAARLQTARRQVARLGRLIESLLDVSRLTAGRVSLELEDLDATELVVEVTHRFQAEAQKAGCALTAQAGAPIMGRWDRMKLDQILSNLISNAIKYGSAQPILVEARELEGMLRISVTDRGMGIEETALERIFGRFERGVSLRHYGGLGLGLFIARQFAEAHAGTILAESQPGAGSRFTVVLPLVPPPAGAPPSGREEAER